jgi:Predicted membrane protein
MAKHIIGWIAVAVSTALAGYWAYWGACENLHEGWYSTSLLKNIAVFIVQYLLISAGFTALALISLKWRTVGLVLFIAVGILFSLLFFHANQWMFWFFIILPLAAIGLLFFFGRPEPLPMARAIVIAVPVIIVIAISVPGFIRISQRLTYEVTGTVETTVNGSTLIWAPSGPGWADGGITWDKASELCSRLSEDGLTLCDEPQNIWRLPTVTEAVGSMMLHGKNAGGTWDKTTAQAKYSVTPDKESPLWNVYSKVIYYWTSEVPENNPQKAYIIVYNGGIYAKSKSVGQDSISFRAVKTDG